MLLMIVSMVTYPLIPFDGFLGKFLMRIALLPVITGSSAIRMRNLPRKPPLGITGSVTTALPGVPDAPDDRLDGDLSADSVRRLPRKVPHADRAAAGDHGRLL